MTLPPLTIGRYADQLKQVGKRKSPYASAINKAAKEQGIDINISQGEEMLARDLQAFDIPFEREFAFCEGRKWRADFRLLNTNILIEVEGGGEEGRHMRHDGFFDDCLKYNRAAILGYRLLRYTFAMVKNGIALKDVEEILKVRPA